jgi:Zn-dependent peptidase ImmA (M78 family)/transcriptional regulator with XRE-family HTH domain
VTVRAIATPDVLRWGRESAGYETEVAARRMQVPISRLEDWESGNAHPTMNQLRKLADIYKRPLSVFFLPKRPRDVGNDPQDFRHLPGRRTGDFSPALRFQLRLARERRQIAIDLMKELELQAPHLAIAATLNDDPERLGTRLRERIGVTVGTQTQWRQPYDALHAWRGLIEAAGVLVFQASGVEVGEMRGFSLADDPLPIVVTNTKDAPNGRIFTMLHELCHVVLNRPGMCELDEDRTRPPEEQMVEVFCNHVAGAALVPISDLLLDYDVAEHHGATWSENELTAIARRFAVSKIVILRRLLIAGRTEQQFYHEKQIEWQENARAAAEAPSNAIVTPDRRAVSEAGRTFVRLVLQSYYSDRITLNDVSKFLHVRLKHLPKIEQAVGA